MREKRQQKTAFVFVYVRYVLIVWHENGVFY